MKTLRLLFIISLFSNGVFGDTGEVKTVSVMEGESLTLHTDTELQTDDVIDWRFEYMNEGVRIALINTAANKISIYNDVLDGRFRDRLQVDDQTGSLTITNITTEHTGPYKLEIIRDNKDQTNHEETFKIVLVFNVTAEIETELDNRDNAKQTDHEKKNNTVQGLSPGAVAGICIFFLSVMAAAAAAGVIFYRRRISEQKKLRVNEGESVTIKAGGEIQRGDQIQWISPDKVTLVTGENGDISETEYTDAERFRDRVKMNHKTGDLTIRDTRKTDGGEYTLKISRDGRTSDRMFSVCVSAGNGGNESATVEIPLLNEAEDPV